MNLRPPRSATTGTSETRTGTGPGRERGRSGLARRLRRGAILAAALLAAAGLSAAPAWAAPAKPAAAQAAAAAPVSPAVHLAGEPSFGPNVYVFTPSMPQSQIQATVNSIATQQISNQFGTQRYALLFEPGTYGSAADPLTFQVGYYTEVAGLGGSPGDVTINGTVDVYNQCFPTTDGSTNCIALDNFWRSLSNLTINISGQTGCQSGTDFWAVSQAAPMRRVAITGGTLSLMDYCSAGPQYASGGFIADSSFSGGTVVNGSQQQFLVRNTSLDGWSNGVWNQVFSGDPGAPAQSFSATSGLAGGTAPYTTLATSPVTQEEPFLQTDSAGQYSVFVPALQHNSSGPSWASGPAAGSAVPISKFFIATPGTSVLAIDAALALGQEPDPHPRRLRPEGSDPGDAPEHDRARPGLPDPGPAERHRGHAGAGRPGSQALRNDLRRRAEELAGPASGRRPAGRRNGQRRRSHAGPGRVLPDRRGHGRARRPTASWSTARDVILDDIWAWRADHGAGVGWTSNTADTGLIVNGNDVTAYGLAVEHLPEERGHLERPGRPGHLLPERDAL